MSVADKIEALTKVQFEHLWTRAVKDTNLSNDRLGLVSTNWEILQEQTVLFLDEWEKQYGKS